MFLLQDVGFLLIIIHLFLLRRFISSTEPISNTDKLNSEGMMKSKKRQAIKKVKTETRKRQGKPGAGKSKYALKQKIDNRPGSPFRSTIPIIWARGRKPP